MIGQFLGPYQVLSKLGEGGMGEVYRARDSRLKREVALKVLPSQVAGDDDRLARFQREAEALAALNHPHIAQIYGLEESAADGTTTLALVMEIVEGEDLAERIVRGAVPIGEALGIARQIAEALEAAHEKGIVHRDLKPANIKVRADGTVKVLDFGLAKALEAKAASATADNTPTIASPAMTQVGIILGTPAYMSPEQARGKAIDTRTDIWAFGCVVFEMLAGRPPFSGETMADTLAAVLERDPDWRLLPDATPDLIRRMLRRCLEKDSTSRIRDIGDARIDIDDALALDRRPSPRRPADGARVPQHNLPAELTSFVGRQSERSELTQMLTASRLVSLTGAGGAGKTRLALRLAADVASEFPDGVWLVDLTPIANPDLVAQTIATAIGVREAPHRSIRDMLLDNLRRRELLLVLDNCEHLIDACAELTEAMLRTAPSLRMIATSREPLRVPGETVWRVSSLSEAEATQLFVDRATAIDATFRATEETAATIARICRRLDGIPLAIELAAARSDALSVDQIDERLHDRFRLLTGGARTALARQRTLEATVQWSYQLLSEQERVLLSRLSVFPAGWTLEAAEKVCGGDGIDEGDMLDLLSRLVNKSLVTLESQAGADRRYRLLETVRQYARERLVELGVADRLRGKHFEFFFNEFRGAQTGLQGHEQVRWLKRLRLEQDNVRAALEWAIAPGTAEEALELTGWLFWYWTKKGAFAEGRQWLERALALNPDGRKSVRARALIGLAHMSYFQGRLDEVADLGAEALPLARGEGDTWATVFALFLQALAAIEHGKLENAAALAAAACDAAAANELFAAGPFLVLGNFAMLSGDVERAQQLCDRSNDLNRRAGEIWGLGIGLLIAAGIRIIRHDFETARAHAIEALSFNQELEDPRGIAWTIETLAGLLAVRGDHGAAARLWAASDRLLENAGLPSPPFIRWLRDRHKESVETSLGPEQLQAAMAEGLALSSEEAIAFARHHVQALR